MQTHFLSLDPPSNFSPIMEVVACFINQDDQILLLRRNPLKPEGNTWCVPGGKRDENETLLEAMCREVQEETGLIIPKEDLALFKTTFSRYPKFDFIYHLFRLNLKNKVSNIRINLAEHLEYRWVTLLETQNLDLTPGIEEALNLLSTYNI